MERIGAKRGGLLAIKVLTPIGVLCVAALLVSSRAATADPAAPLADGKYEKVVVEGRTVAMIHVKDHGTVVLVDTDGKKPRTWEEQFKSKGNLPGGVFDEHKTDVNGNGTFEDDPVDRKGAWVIDAKGNITAQ